MVNDTNRNATQKPPFWNDIHRKLSLPNDNDEQTFRRYEQKNREKAEIDEEQNNKIGVFLLESKRHLIDAILCLCAPNNSKQQRSSVGDAFTSSLIWLFIQIESSRFYVHGTTLPLCHRPVVWFVSRSCIIPMPMGNETNRIPCLLHNC